jgi:hypothetical protein
MKIKLTALAITILMGTAFSSQAGSLAPPAPYRTGPLKSPYLAPNLFKSEKAAFAALEGAMQEAEAVIYQGGCAAAAGASGRTWNIAAFVDQTGTGYVKVGSNGVKHFILRVKEHLPAPLPSFLGGTIFHVTGTASNVINGKILPAYNGSSYYSKTGQMMTQNARFQVGNVNGAVDFLSGSVIKDFYKVLPCTSSCGSGQVPIIYDWGLQSVSKNTVPQDKWWQRSRVNRSDGVDAQTVFEKDRLFSAKNDGVCKIKIQMSGNNDASSFEQSGTLTIKKTAP